MKSPLRAASLRARAPSVRRCVMRPNSPAISGMPLTSTNPERRAVAANELLLYCRAGFEAECAAEVLDAIAAGGGEGRAPAGAGSAWGRGALQLPPAQPQLSELGFARPLRRHLGAVKAP